MLFVFSHLQQVRMSDFALKILLYLLAAACYFHMNFQHNFKNVSHACTHKLAMEQWVH